MPRLTYQCLAHRVLTPHSHNTHHGLPCHRPQAMAREQATALEGQLADCALQAQLLRAGVFEMRNPFTIARLAASRKRALALLSA